MKNVKSLAPTLAIVLSISVFLSSALFAQEKTTYVKPHKNPGASFIMALIIPGAGQMYNDQVGLGFGVFGGTLALAGGGYVLISESANAVKTTTYNNPFGGTYEVTEVDVAKRDAMKGAGIALIALGGLAHVAAFVYAPLKSKMINKKNGDPAYASSEVPTHFYSMGITKSGGVGVALNF